VDVAVSCGLKRACGLSEYVSERSGKEGVRIDGRERTGGKIGPFVPYLDLPSGINSKKRLISKSVCVKYRTQFQLSENSVASYEP
jgi:hypothetical protein